LALPSFPGSFQTSLSSGSVYILLVPWVSDLLACVPHATFISDDCSHFYESSPSCWMFLSFQVCSLLVISFFLHYFKLS
jgi:hypothetical protein